MEPGEVDRPAWVVALDSVGVQCPSHDACARFALGGDADDDQRPDAVGLTTGDLQRGHRAHREPEEMERLDPERVDEGHDVVDEHRVGEAVGNVPTGAPVTARIGQVRQERLRKHGQLGGEVSTSGGTAAVEHHEGRPGADLVVADLEAVGSDGGHRADDASARGLPIGLGDHCGSSKSHSRAGPHAQIAG